MKLPYIIKKPIITERTMDQASHDEYTFAVSREATKGQIKTAIEDYFGVKVVGVRTSMVKGKTKRVGRLRRPIVIADSKKAIIKVKAGQKLALFESES